ncbi:hypothetical protein WBJ53_31995 [Spirosoma sp. SC4-14]|uniref:hypothetical protein n=1 Tax=Spirosoma sp. SC4-14 TaxID=3128900 RepID=UPI0030CF5E52
MNRIRTAFSIVFVVALVFSCSEKRVCGCVFPASPLAGDWNLTKITYGLTQKTVTPAEAGYTEVLSFTGTVGNGKYSLVRNGIPIESSNYSLSFPKGGSTEGLIFYQVDSTQQSFQLSDNKLVLSERSSDGTAIADGAIYEYSR